MFQLSGFYFKPYVLEGSWVVISGVPLRALKGSGFRV